MGAWGSGAFENDGALDFIADVQAPNFSFDSIQWAFEDEDYIEADGGEMALALAEVAVAIRKNGPSPVADLDLAAVSHHFTPEAIGFIREQVQRTLSDAEHSELYELWEETDELDEWLKASRATLEELG